MGKDNHPLSVAVDTAVSSNEKKLRMLYRNLSLVMIIGSNCLTMLHLMLSGICLHNAD